MNYFVLSLYVFVSEPLFEVAFLGWRHADDAPRMLFGISLGGGETILSILFFNVRF
jgi:hypothetical protein